MTLLEYLQSHNGGETVSNMLAEIAGMHEAKHPPFIGLPANRSELERQLRVLKSQGLIFDAWPEGAKEGVWRVGMKRKVKVEQPVLF